MSMWKKAMDYLGLGPDEAYDDYVDAPDERPARAARAPREEPARPARGYSDYDTDAQVRPMPARPSFPSREPDVGRRPTPATDDSNVQPRPINPRPAPVSRTAGGGVGEPHTVRPRRFESAQEIADKFKEGLPVIMNLEASEKDVARRLIDFASGLCYGLNGTMEKVASGVYLLKPSVRPAGYDDGYDG
jgi:cell division inhibitor SepF